MKKKAEEKANEKNMIEDIANERYSERNKKWMAAQFPDP